MNNTTLFEDECNEEWWQPELHCAKCNCTFMWTSYPDFPKYPNFCPNCGSKFDKLRIGEMIIFNYELAQKYGSKCHE